MVHRCASALLLAAGATWQIIKHYGWSTWLSWLLIVGDAQYRDPHD
jgi:hypothetical protein